MFFTCRTFRCINTLTPVGAHAKSQHLVRSRAGLTSILADFNGVSVQTGIPNNLWLAPDDGDRSVIFILNEQVQRSAGGLCKAQTVSQVWTKKMNAWKKKLMQEISFTSLRLL